MSPFTNHCSDSDPVEAGNEHHKLKEVMESSYHEHRYIRKQPLDHKIEVKATSVYQTVDRDNYSHYSQTL